MASPSRAPHWRRMVISGILRDFTPTLNPDFKAQPDANDRGIVANLIDPDALPGAARSRLRS